jgi:hypothetical protein
MAMPHLGWLLTRPPPPLSSQWAAWLHARALEESDAAQSGLLARVIASATATSHGDAAAGAQGASNPSATAAAAGSRELHNGEGRGTAAGGGDDGGGVEGAKDAPAAVPVAALRDKVGGVR